MIYPEFLSKGNTIGVPAPSAGGSEERYKIKFQAAAKKLKDMGYNLVLSKNLYNCEKGRSASAEERGKEINKMFADQNINFITAASGGCFLVECLPYIDFEKIAENPKFFQGFSDPTGIIFPLTTKYDIATIYGKNFGSYGMEKYSRDIEENLQIITGNLVEQESYEMYEGTWDENASPTGGYNLTDKVEWKVLNGKEAHISGRVIAGCMDVIVNLAGTRFDGTKDFCQRYKDDGIVWIFDVCDFTKEVLICYLWQLNELGYFKNAKGIAFGRCGNDASAYEYTMGEALQDSVISKLGIPIIYDIDITHKKPNMTIVNGSIINIDVKNGKGIISQSCY